MPIAAEKSSKAKNRKMPIGLSITEDAEGVVGALGSEAVTQRLEE